METSFFKAIHEKRLVKIQYNSKSKGIIERVCVPLDYGPSKRSKDQSNKYHFLDLDSPDGAHVLPVSPDRLLRIELLNEYFNPEQYVTWDNIEWFVPRDWGEKS